MREPAGIFHYSWLLMPLLLAASCTPCCVGRQLASGANSLGLVNGPRLAELDRHDSVIGDGSQANPGSDTTDERHGDVETTRWVGSMGESKKGETQTKGIVEGSRAEEEDAGGKGIGQLPGHRQLNPTANDDARSRRELGTGPDDVTGDGTDSNLKAAGALRGTGAPAQVGMEARMVGAIKENRRPVIGVYTHPYYGPGVHPKASEGKPKPTANGSMIAASYVRMLQAGGALVVPIFYDSTEAELKKAFAAVNLVLFQGGFTSLSRFNLYYKNAKKLLEMALRSNDGGDHFAVHGTCLGLELLATLVCEEPKSRLVAETDARGHPAVLRFTSEGAKERSLFAGMPRDLIRRLEAHKLTMENHMYGLLPAKVSSNSKLEAFFEVLTTSPDQQGQEYVSTMAAYHYPISATQWHPEKPPFEFFSTLNVPHSTSAIQVSTAVTSFLLREARKNSHRLCKEELVHMVVDNYDFQYQANLESHDYDSIYIFPTRQKRRVAAKKRGPQPSCEEVPTATV